jgi:hypothetical protein
MAAQGCENGAVAETSSRAPVAAGHGLSTRDQQIVADWFGPHSSKHVAERNDCCERYLRKVWQQAKAAGLLPAQRKQRVSERHGERETFATGDVDPQAAREVWRQVITQAAADAVGDIEPQRAEARAWFLKSNRDFELVCEFAGFEPTDIRRRFEDAIKEIDIEACA